MVIVDDNERATWILATTVVAALCSFARYTTLTRAGHTMATLRQGN